MNFSTDTGALRAHISREGEERITWADKPMDSSWYGMTAGELIAESPSIERFSTPVMTLDANALVTNTELMRLWCREHGVSLAPHGKTTMAPVLWLAQLEAGAWGITVANESQLRVARGVGISRIILGNQFIRPDGLAWLSRELDADPEFQFICWVDSLDGVRLMDEALRAVGGRRPVQVCVEVGTVGGRTGARTLEQALDIARAVVASRVLELSGTCGYEGGAGGRAIDAEVLGGIDSFLRLMVQVHSAIDAWIESDEAILTAGGSTFFDRVAEILAPEARGREERRPTRVIVRSGGYIIHDDGMYRVTTPSTRDAGPQFTPSMHVWSRVISIPEPGIALLDAGRRDVPYDVGLPEVQLVRRHDGDLVTTRALTDCTVYDLNDQHAFVRIPADSTLAVGDVVRLGLSHPCTAFDKWRIIPVIDDSNAKDPRLVGLVRTYF